MSALLAVLLIAQAAPAAQPTPCATPAPLPAELAGWSQMRAATAAASVRAKSPAPLRIGRGANVTLLPGTKVSYAVAPEKPGAAGSYGGILGFSVPSAGRYRVALGAGAWIDVIGGGGKALTSVAHGHGPACSGVRKMVDFDLAPGRYTLQVSGNAAPTLGVMIARIAQ